MRQGTNGGDSAWTPPSPKWYCEYRMWERANAKKLWILRARETYWQSAWSVLSAKFKLSPLPPCIRRRQCIGGLSWSGRHPRDPIECAHKANEIFSHKQNRVRARVKFGCDSERTRRSYRQNSVQRTSSRLCRSAGISVAFWWVVEISLHLSAALAAETKSCRDAAATKQCVHILCTCVRAKVNTGRWRRRRLFVFITNTRTAVRLWQRRALVLVLGVVDRLHTYARARARSASRRDPVRITTLHSCGGVWWMYFIIPVKHIE